MPTRTVFVLTCVWTLVPQFALPVVAELLVTMPLFCPSTTLLPVLHCVVELICTLPTLLMLTSPWDMPTKNREATSNKTTNAIIGKTFLNITRRAEAV